MGGYKHAVSQLDNGLTVVTVAMPHLHSATISAFVRVGARHETERTNGLSHFLEHMFFRGCDGFPDSTALNGAMEDLGGFLDGYTSRDHSSFFSTVHPDHVTEATELLGGMLRSPHFRDLEIERSIILEEILDALDDRGREIDLDVISHRVAFPGHPLGQSIDGPRKNLRRFTLDDLRRHRRRFYGAKNMVLCFAGNISAGTCRRAAKRSFGPLFAGRTASEGRRPPPLQGTSMKVVRTDESQTRFRVTFRAVPQDHADFAPLALLRRVLDGGMSARLQVELVEKRGIVYEVGAHLDTYSDCGTLDFELAVAHKKLTQAIVALGDVLTDLRAGPIAQAELDRVRRRARFGVEFGLDSPQELSQWFGAAQLFRRPTPPEARLAQLEAVSTQDLHRVAQTYLSPARMSVAAVGGGTPMQVSRAKRAVRRFGDQLAATM